MTIGLLSVICNGDAISEMELLGETHEALLSEFLELPHGIPSMDTLERVLAKLDPKVLGAQFQTFMWDMSLYLETEVLPQNKTELLMGYILCHEGARCQLIFVCSCSERNNA